MSNITARNFNLSLEDISNICKALSRQHGARRPIPFDNGRLEVLTLYSLLLCLIILRVIW